MSKKINRNRAFYIHSSPKKHTRTAYGKGYWRFPDGARVCLVIADLVNGGTALGAERWYISCN